MTDLRILIVEDEAIAAMDIQQRLLSLGYTLTDVAGSGTEGVNKAMEIRPDLVLMDIMLPGEIDGIMAAGQIRSRFDIPIIFLTAYGDEKTIDRAMIAEPHGYLTKPFQDSQLHTAIAIALYKHEIERKLRESEQRYSNLVENGSDGIIVLQDGLLKFANSKAVEITGLPITEVLGKPFIDFVAPQYRELVIERYKKRIAGEDAPNRYEIGILGRDGSVMPVEVNASLVDYEGRPAVLSMIRDITERKRVEEQLRVSEEKFHSLFRSVPIPTFTWKQQESDFVFVDYNEAAERITEGNISSLVGFKATELYRDNPHILDYFWRCARQKSTIEAELDYKLLTTGALKTMSMKFVSVQPDLIMVHTEDITERKRAEEKLKTAEQNFRNSMDNSPLGILIDSIDNEHLYANKALLDIYGFSDIEEFNATPAKERLTPRSYAEHLQRRELRKTGKPVPSNYEMSIIRKDGETRHLSASRKEVQWNGKTQLQVVFQDVTEHKRLEEELSLRVQLLDAATDLIHVTDLDGKILYVNETSCLNLGYSREELLGHNISEFNTASSYKRTYPGDNDASEDITATREVVHVRKDGTLLPVEVHYRLINWGGKRVFLDVVRDITERKRAEEMLRLQAELLDLEPDSVDLHDFEGNIIYANRAFYETLGYTKEELLNTKLSQLDDPESEKATPARLKELTEKGRITFNVNHRHKNGMWIPLEVHGSLIEIGGRKLIMSVAHDISERQKLQEQLMAQDRLVSIGQLVSGIAHEINNPLTGIIGFSDLLLHRELPDDVRADLKIINDEAQRTAKIVKNLLTFSRQRPEGKTSLNINGSIEKALALRAHEHNISNIHVVTHLAPDLPPIMGDSSQLQQVFFNLIINAEQAMLGASNKGTITITTQRLGDRVRISLADDGPGISPEHMKRLFTPFFTTKEVGKGTGLGLSICHGIITEHGGAIYAESEPGKGATFIVELPVNQQTNG